MSRKNQFVMKNHRINRNKIAIINFIICFIVSFFIIKVTPSKINNYSQIINASLILSLFIAIFLLLCVVTTLITNISNTKFSKMMSELGTTAKLTDRIMLTIMVFISNSYISFIGLFFDTNACSLLSRFIISIWLALTIAGFINTFYLLFVLIKWIDLYHRNKKIKGR